MTVAEIEAFISAFGLRPPPRDEPAFTPREAEVLIELGQARDVWPVELDIRLARVWGPLLARVAQAGGSCSGFEPSLRSDYPDRLAGVRAVQEALARLMPLSTRSWSAHTGAGSSTGSPR